MTEQKHIQQLLEVSLMHQTIDGLHLVEPNDLFLTFDSSLKLNVIGDNGPFESWQLQANRDDEKVLIVAGPGERLSLFE